MEKKKIKDLYFFHPKSKIKAGEGLDKGSYPFYTSSMEQSKWLNSYEFNTRALVLGTGGKASLHFANGTFSVSTDCFALSSKQEEVEIRYSYYYLISKFHLIERGFKGAGLKHISKEYVENIEIKYPNLEIQNKIVAILDKAKAILDKWEQTINRYNELLRAVFLKMFGMQNSDFIYWEDIEVGALGKKAGSFRTGPFGSSLKHERFKEEGELAVLGIDNVVDNIFKWKKKRFLSFEEFKEFRRYQVFPRDVIITIMGTVGRSAVIPDDVGLAINTKHLAAITLDETKCNPFYLAYSIHSNPYIQFQLKARARGAIMDGFNLTLIKELKLKNAPIELQNKFEKIYRKCLTNKERVIEAYKKSITLFEAISQLSFSGELTFNTAVDLEVLLEKDYDFFKANSSTKSIQLLLERIDTGELNDNRFSEQQTYDKAKSFVFELLKEGKIKQVFDEKAQKVKLTV